MTGGDSLGDVAIDLYLDLLMRSLIGDILRDSDTTLGVGNLPAGTPLLHRAMHLVGRAAQRRGVELRRKRPYDAARREVGLDWPERAESMIGLTRMRNLRHCVETVLADEVPGDLIETGVWRGGATIFMRGVLAAHGDRARTVWVADSFDGLPPPDPQRYPVDRGDQHHTVQALKVGQNEVTENFRRYGLLDEQVGFLVGWFEDTLPTAPIERLAVLRLDGDMYSSTTQALESLYPRLSTGGFCIVDDFALPGCRAAVDDFRRARGIVEPVVDIDGVGAFWRREA